MRSFQFVHTGDIHLDSPLKGLSGQDGTAADRIRTATRAAFQDLVTIAISDRVAFMVIAGDLYDGDWRDYQTGLFFVKQMGRLNAEGIPVYLLHGNHDAESVITKRLTLPDNVHVFGNKKPQTLKLDDLRVALHGQSFRFRAVTENLAAAYPAPVQGFFNIGVLHTALGGLTGPHENYAPCSLHDLVNKGYEYWALAHVHNGGVLNENPHVVFCGNLQGRHIRETGAKSAQLVTVEDGLVKGMESLHVDVVRWQSIDVTVDHCARYGEVIDELRAQIERAASEAQGRLLACRIQLTGVTALHNELLAKNAQLVADARSVALALGDDTAWVDRVVSKTTSPSIALTNADAGAINDLQVLLKEAASDTALQEQFATEFGELARKLPHDISSVPDDPLLEAVVKKEFGTLIEQAHGHLIASLGVGRR